VYVKIVMTKGDKVPWHTHKNEDELFYIIEGSLIIKIENKTTLHTGETINENKVN
jgi:quercetin dioxygenase-like cupin family protein